MTGVPCEGNTWQAVWFSPGFINIGSSSAEKTSSEEKVGSLLNKLYSGLTVCTSARNERLVNLEETVLYFRVGNCPSIPIWNQSIISLSTHLIDSSGN
jgi:hypothetical protein